MKVRRRTEETGVSRGSFLYMRIYEEIRRLIEEDGFGESGKLPSDEELMGRYGVSMITVKKALGMLKDEGLLQRIPGVGTFVVREAGTASASSAEQALPPTIGIVMEHVSSAFGLDLVYRLDQKAEERGYKTMLRFSYYQREKETREINYLVQSRIAGLVVMPCHGTYYNPEILKLILEGFPVVVIDKKLEGISVPSVRTDNRQAVAGLVRHLADQGSRRIGFVTSESVGTSSLQDRRNGFYEAVGERSLEALPECTLAFDQTVFDHQPATENTERAAHYLKTHKGRIDGLVCAEYSMLPAIQAGAQRAGIELGRDVRIGCVDGPESLRMPHMKQDECKMADIVLDLLLSQINGNGKLTDLLVPAMLRGN